MLPRPTVELINAECKAFDDENGLAEQALDQLRAAFRPNTDPHHVLLKVLVLNELYRTRIRSIDIATVATHIVWLASSHGLDQLLEEGSLEAVSLIANCPDVKEYLSFASKFCSWHNPTAYPIFDGNVRACLWAYRKQAPFAEFRNGDLWCYRRLVEIVVAFRDYYELTSLTFKQLDKFMYRSGDRILRAQKDRQHQMHNV